MLDIFKTFKPKSLLLSEYIDYYYLDLKPDNEVREFECFPHYNNTISIYQSHIHLENGNIQYQENGCPYQIFTPIRENILKVKQIGPLHRVVIVFKPLGVYQFFRGRIFNDYIANVSFFSKAECTQIFQTNETAVINDLLDEMFLKRYEAFELVILEKGIPLLLHNQKQQTVEELSHQLQVSRRHLNRLFQQYLGVSVKKFQEIVLFRKTINQKLFHPENNSFTQLAYRFHYNDQSHFIKSYKSFTGSSPKDFFRNGKLLGNQDTFWHLPE